MTKFTVEPEILNAMMESTRLVHQHTDTGWKQLHRLVATIPGPRAGDPVIVVEGGWTNYEAPAILSTDELAVASGFATEDDDTEPCGGFMAFTEYWEDQLPRIIQFSRRDRNLSTTEDVEWNDVKPGPGTNVEVAEAAEGTFAFPTNKKVYGHFVDPDELESDGGNPD